MLHWLFIYHTAYRSGNMWIPDRIFNSFQTGAFVKPGGVLVEYGRSFKRRRTSSKHGKGLLPLIAGRPFESREREAKLVQRRQVSVASTVR